LPAGRPLVCYDPHGFPLPLPLSHPLPRILAVDRNYQLPLRLLAESFGRDGTSAIDIGANVGDTAVMLALGGCTRVTCVEGNGAFIPSLRANAAAAAERGWDFRLVDRYVLVDTAGVGARVQTRYGTAKLILDDEPSGSHENLVSVDEVLCVGDEVAILKIDTDGMDLAILESFLDIDKERAIQSFFVEFTPQAESIVPYLTYFQRHGFDELHWFDHHGNFVTSSDMQDDVTATRMTQVAAASNAYFDVAALRADTAIRQRFGAMCQTVRADASAVAAGPSRQGRNHESKPSG